jgi:hypothetical protein
MSQALQKIGELPLAVARPQPTVADMLSAVIDKGVTGENVNALEKLVGLYERMQVRDSEKAFAAAFVQLQQEIPTIQGFRGVPDKNGNIKFVYANFDDIDAVVRPICLRNGFSYSFRETGMSDGRVTVSMTLTHCAGHSREIPYTVRIGSGPPGATESQSDVSGHTYAKRGALESGLSLRVVGERGDARAEGGPITAEQADELERRVALLNVDRVAFLKFAGAATFKEIPSSKYDILDQQLAKKERK